MEVPSHYQNVHRGFWTVRDRTLPPKVCSALPRASDRYLESVHFAELALAIRPTQAGTKHINWYTSAHMGAYIGIFDAAKLDIKSLHQTADFNDTPLAKEERANPQTSDFQYKDPLNASHLYRALRHLRVHFALPIVVLEARPLVSSEPHWYVRLIDLPTYRQLRHAPLTDEELSGYQRLSSQGDCH